MQTATDRVDATAWIEIARIPSVVADMPANTDWLSASEQARLADLRHAGRRDQYLAGHWLARVLLARALGEAPGQWQLLERKSRPPSVQGHGDALRVSISHTEDWISAAVANVPIGIDLEQRPRKLDAAIEPLLLNASEALGSVEPDALLQRWVAKEAWIKRDVGSALATRLQNVHLQPASREHADVVIDSHAAFHFGLAVTSRCRVARRCDLTLKPSVAFSIQDLDAPRDAIESVDIDRNTLE